MSHCGRGRKVSFTTFRKGARGRRSTQLLLPHIHTSQLFLFFFKSGFIFVFGLLGNGAGRKSVKHTALFHSLEAIAFTLDQSHTELSQELVQVSGTGKSGPGYQPVSPPRAPSALSLCTSRGCPAACDRSTSPAREQKVFR